MMKIKLLLSLVFCLSILCSNLHAQNSVVATAFLDQNGNGMDDEALTAPGLTNAELFLVEIGGMVYNHVETAAGVYTFDNGGAGLPDGTYSLQYVETPWTPAEILPGGGVLAITLLNVGIPTADNDVDPVTGISSAIVLVGGAQTEMDIDLGVYFASAIGDFVWEDINGDGFQDGELANGIDGVTVTLLDGTGAPAVDTDSNPVATEITAGGGEYLFGNIPPGDYIVQFSLPAGPNWFATTFNPGDFSNDSDADPANLFQTLPYTINNNIIYNSGNLDAGFIQAVIIGNMVWEDLNGDGIQDPGEPGINGVEVNLYDDTGTIATDANGLPVAPQFTANVAGIDGIYSFIEIPPGQYQVEFSLPAPIGGVNWYPTEFDPGDVEPDDSDLDSDASNNPADGVNYLRTAFITVESAETDEELRIDAGFWLPAMIGDNVFCDENGNGIDDDGVGGVDGIEVVLVEVSSGAIAQDADGNNLTTTTAGGGMYNLELVPPGIYFLQFSFTGVTPDPPFVFTVQNDPNGIGNDFNDSDVDPNPGGTLGNTEEFEVTSQDTEEEEKWDAGVYQVINIFGTIWLEDDMNNMFDGETGPGGVFLEIFNADNDGKIDDAFTNTGDYEFIGLAPGNYYIIFGTAGTALESATPCPGSNDANDMIDNDDNGGDGPIVQTTDFELLSNCDASTPPEVFYIDFCYFFDCNEPNLLAATACEDVLDPNVICDISILGTFCNLMPTADSGGNQPNPLCSDGGAPHNISWFAFVAYGGTYSITVTPTGCSGSTTGVDGVQIGLYTDCTFTESVYCNPDCNLDAVTFDSDILEEGQTYYFFIDGCSSSVCSYEVEIDGSPLPPNLLPDDVCIDVDGVLECSDATYCPDAAVDFVATDFNLTVDFSWTVTTVSGIPYTGDPSPMTAEEILSISFPDEGVYEICLTQVDNGCAAQQWNGNICRTITIEGIDDEEFIDKTICQEDIGDFDFSVFNPEDPNTDGETGWIADEPALVFGSNMGTVTTLEGCMYDQEFELLMFPESDQGLVDMIVCKDELPLMIDEIQVTELSFAGILIFDLADYTLENSEDINNCDSIIDINIELLDLLGGGFEPGVCIPEGIIMTFNYLDGISTEAEFITFEWFDPSMTLLPDDFWETGNPLNNLAPVSIGSGTYTLIATITKGGKFCTFEYPIDIDFETLFPPTPNISGPGLDVCEADSIVTYTAIDFGDAFMFTWDYPADVASATPSGAMGEVLTINWSGSAGGSVTLTTQNACGPSQEVEIVINVIPQPTPVFTFTTEVCIDSCTMIEFQGDVTDINIFDWDFDGGTENSGTGGVGPGPHCVSWSDAGDKTITLTYTDNAGCVSSITTETVTVTAPIAPPTINCNPNTGEVSFTWDDITDATYSVEVTSISSITGMLHEGVLAGTTYTVTGLEDGETVTIILTIFTNDVCQMITSVSPGCTSQDCVAPTITLVSDVLSFCLDPSNGTATITPDIVSGENGTGVFSGTGIIDPDNGIFDPSTANIGVNTITYLFMTDDPIPCIGNQTIQIEVFETPMASFTSDVDTICITDVFNLDYNGTSGAAVYNWDYGVGGSGTGGPTPTVTFDSPGDKTIRLTVEKDNCESESTTIDVFVQPELVPIEVICSIQEIDQVEFSWNAITGATEYSVSINGGPPFTTTGTSHSETGLNPDDIVTITVTVLTDSKCPGSSDTQMCTAQSCPTFTLTYDNPVTDLCVDGTNTPLTLQADASGGVGGGTYIWSGPNVTDDQFDPNGLPEGQVELFVTYEEGGCEESGSVLVNITSNPMAAFSVDMTTICIGETVTILYEGSQLTNQMISWTSGGETITPGSNSNEYSAIFNSAGTFDIQLDVTNGSCTTAPALTTITVEPELVFETIDCIEALDQIEFSWLPVDCASEYEVFIGGVSQGTQTNTDFTVTGLTVGEEVTIEVIAVSGCACGNVMTTRMCEAQDCTPVNLSLSTMDGISEFCMSSDLTAVEIIAETVGSDGNGTFTWSGPGVDQNGMFDPIAAGVGTHTIYFDFLESAGCPYVDSIMFTINELPEVTQQFDEINCFDQTNTMLEVIPTGGDGNYTITLNGSAGDLMNDVPAGTYDIIVTDGNLCSAETSVTITVPNEPMPTITGDTQLELGDSSSYSIQSGLFDGNVVDSIIWTANGTVICNDAGCFSIGNQIPAETTIYEVTVHYNSGCLVTTTTTVEVTVPPMVSIVEIPNIISPNNDGDNDTWQIVTNDENVIINSIRIFDRWGNMVWSFSGPVSPMVSNPVWDGKFNNKDLQPGVYVYFLDFDQDGRQNKIRSGDITIVN